MYCSVFFAFDNGVITLLVQKGSPPFHLQASIPVLLCLNLVKKERIVTNRNSYVSGNYRFRHGNPKHNNPAALSCQCSRTGYRMHQPDLRHCHD